MTFVDEALEIRVQLRDASLRHLLGHRRNRHRTERDA
jgi:hypothetical protein